MIARLPIRVRVTAAFAAAMAVVLAAVGAFLYQQLGERLDESVDDNLEVRFGELALLAQTTDIEQPGGYTIYGPEEDDRFSQLLTPGGGVAFASSAPLSRDSVLDDTELGAAAEAETFLNRESIAGLDGEARILAAPLEAGGSELIGVVGASLEDRDEALASLAAFLGARLVTRTRAPARSRRPPPR